MAYEELIHSMEGDADRRIQEVRLQVRAAVDEERETVHRQIAEIRARLADEGEARIEVERHQRLYRAREETKAGIARVREEYLQRVIATAEEELALLRGRDEYRAVLEELVHEALAALAEPGARVHVDPRDESTVQAILAGLAEPVKLVPDLTVAGGAVVESADGRIRIDNTFEARLVRAGEIHRRELYRRLFGGE